MRRRQFARMIGAGVVGAGITGTVAGRDQGDPPNDQVATTRVHPLGDEPIAVEAGDWITHYTGWVDGEGGDYERSDVIRWLDSIEMSAYIDGVKVENPGEHWGDIHQYTLDDETTSYIVFWEYTTPPKKPGRHTFRTVTRYPDGFVDGDDTIAEPGEAFERVGEYIVSPPS